MTSKEQKVREFIRNNPSLSGNQTLKELQDLGLGIRKTNFLEIFREVRKLPKPTKAKREASIPKKFRKVKPTVKKVKPTKVITPKPTKKLIQKKLPIPFEKTKFGKIVKDIENIHNISEQKAIERTRVLLKIPKIDFRKLNSRDRFVLEQHGY